MKRLYHFKNGTKGGVYMTPAQANDFFIGGNHLMLPLDLAMSLISDKWPISIKDGCYEVA